jgi:hypothetical protein
VILPLFLVGLVLLVLVGLILAGQALWAWADRIVVEHRAQRASLALPRTTPARSLESRAAALVEAFQGAPPESLRVALEWEHFARAAEEKATEFERLYRLERTRNEELHARIVKAGAPLSPEAAPEQTTAERRAEQVAEFYAGSLRELRGFRPLPPGLSPSQAPALWSVCGCRFCEAAR